MVIEYIYILGSEEMKLFKKITRISLIQYRYKTNGYYIYEFEKSNLSDPHRLLPNLLVYQILASTTHWKYKKIIERQ